MPDLIRVFEIVVDRLLYLERRRLIRVNGVMLHPSEVHMLLAARDYNNFTGIAAHFGITKGAVSQTMARLSKKGFITISKDRSAKNAASVEYTDSGRKALQKIDEIRGSIASIMTTIFEQFEPEEKEIIQRFLAELNSLLDSDQAVKEFPK